MKTGCIYCFENIINGKKYIGQTVQSIRQYMENHYIQALDKNVDKVFYRAIRKHGSENFKWYILEDNIKSKKELNEKEIYYIKLYNTYMYNENSHGYNMTLGGDGGWAGNILRKGKTEKEIYGEEKAKEVALKKSQGALKHWSDPERKKEHLKTNHYYTNNPMNYIDFKGDKNPNAGKKHPKMNSKMWLICDEEGNEQVIIGLHSKEFLIDKSKPYSLSTLMKYSKLGKYWKGFWCLEIKDFPFLYGISIKSKHYKN